MSNKQIEAFGYIGVLGCLQVGDKFALVLAKSLFKDGTLVKDTYDQVRSWP